MKCKVRVMIVADGEIRFSESNDGLWYIVHLYENLKTSTAVDVDLTLAHRNVQGSSYNGVISNFKFTDEFIRNSRLEYDTCKDFLDSLDCLFLFGYSKKESELSPEESKSINDAMDAGLGVFAAGDHESHGYALCGQLKRVRAMQYWDLDKPSSALNLRNTSIAPLPDLPESALSLLGQFESDAIPMNLFVARYHVYQEPQPEKLSEEMILRPTLSHPVLCGRASFSVVDILPDHLHEGEIVKPSRKNIQKYKSDFPDEFPWEIIARSRNYDVLYPNQLPLRATDYGVIGAYNGFVKRLGRIVVDSSFHHWLDGNILGKKYGEVADPVFRFGFKDKVDILDKFNAYYCNVLFWLVRKSCQKEMIALILYEGLMTSLLKDNVTSSMTVPIKGRSVIRTLGRVYGESNVRSFWLNFLDDEVREKMLLAMKKVSSEEMFLLDEYAYGKVTEALMEESRVLNKDEVMSFFDVQIPLGLRDFKRRIETYQLEQSMLLDALPSVCC